MTNININIYTVNSQITFNRKNICLLKDLTKRNLSPGVTIGVYIDCKRRIRNIYINFRIEIELQNYILLRARHRHNIKSCCQIVDLYKEIDSLFIYI